ncbi:MAG: flagellar biosynthesis anti-sigma factor FlgM [Thermoguttaceae bacterium]|jgi:anti-sigma28 factor (negative regulator of flagellin synthesis)
MHIYGPANLHGAQPIGPPHSARLTQRQVASESTPIQDELQISDAAQLVDKVRELPDVRQDRVNEIRTQIARGAYETSEKLEIAVGRLLDEIG